MYTHKIKLRGEAYRKKKGRPKMKKKNEESNMICVTITSIPNLYQWIDHLERKSVRKH